MPEPEETKLTITTQNIDLSLNKEDLVAIAVAQYREQVEKEMPILKAKIQDLGKTLEDKKQKAWSELVKVVQGYFSPIIKAYENLYGEPPMQVLLCFNQNFVFGQHSSNDKVLNSAIIRVRFDKNIPEITISGPQSLPDGLRAQMKAIIDQIQEDLHEGYQTLKKLEKRYENLRHTNYQEYRDKAHAKLAQSVIKKLTGEDAALLRSALNLNEDLALPARPEPDEA